jgi:hypothetical protein
MLTSNRSLQDLAASDDFLDTAADSLESDTEVAPERRARDDRDLAPIISMIVALGLSLPFWWALIWAVL